MVTVIITTYKRADFLERAIESVLNQSYKDFELIVVDDNDKETEYRREVENLMKKYETNPKVIYIKHEKNKNGAVARNTGINIAKGEYISFLDDDDYYFKDRLKILVSTLDKYKEYNAAYTSVIKIRNNKIYEYIDAKEDGNLEFEFLQLKSCIGTGSNMFFRTKTLKELGGFDESFMRHQDLEVMVRFFEKGNIIKAVDKVLVLKDEASRINAPNIEKQIQNGEKYLNRFESNIKKYKEKSNIIYAECYYQMLKFCIRSGNKQKTKLIKEKYEKYQKLSIKRKLKLLILKINRHIDIEGLKDKIKNDNIIKKLDDDVIEEIKQNHFI